MYVWPISIIVFSMLIFASYDIIDGGMSYSEPALFWIMCAMAVLSIILFIWDLVDKFNVGFFDSK